MGIVMFVVGRSNALLTLIEMVAFRLLTTGSKNQAGNS
jgi:hypothetical protein